MEFADFYSLQNIHIFDALAKAQITIPRYKKVVVAISGGSDSDIVMDMVEKTKGDSEVMYVWFDTGLEYQATKNHLKYLEEKYGVKIHREKAKKPIPTCVREYGVPFLSKFVSEMMSRLQKFNFQWEDEEFEILLKKYPKCRSALRWWCNKNGTHFNIDRNIYLKEFIIKNPPKFKIANKCCLYAKKKVAKEFEEKANADLSVIGVRKAEGGIRATAYKSCYTQEKSGKMASFRPIFWLSDDDKRDYENQYGVCHSDCYKKYGLKRTGCVGCPYGKNVNEELAVIQKYEPKLYKAVMKIFGESYEYTKKYRQFCKEMKCKETQDPDQMTLFDLFYDFALS